MGRKYLNNTAVALVSAIVVACGNQSPTKSTALTEDTADLVRPAVRSFAQVATNTVWIHWGTVRVTNTSGGKVIVVANGRENSKPMLVHFVVDEERTDVARFRDEGMAMYAGTVKITGHAEDGTPITFSDLGSVWNGQLNAGASQSGIRDLKEGMIAVFTRTDQSSGRMRPWNTNIEFTLHNTDAGWTIGNPLHRGIQLDALNPHPSKVVFHPVLPSDSLGNVSDDVRTSIVDQTEDLAQTHRDGVFMDLIRHAPIVLGEILVGEPVLIDTTHWAFRDGHFRCGDRSYGCLALDALETHFEFADCDGNFPLGNSKSFGASCLENPIDNTTDLNFHVAIALADLPGKRTHSGGGALQGSPYTYVNVYDDEATNASLLLHEMGHSLDLSHMYSGHNEQINDTNYPLTAAPGLINVDGYEVDRRRNISIIDADSHFDFMTYTSPEWISAYHYRKMAEYRFGIEPTLAATRRIVLEPGQIVRCW